MKKRIIRLISFILAVAVVFTSVDATAYAEVASEIESPQEVGLGDEIDDLESTQECSEETSEDISEEELEETPEEAVDELTDEESEETTDVDVQDDKDGLITGFDSFDTITTEYKLALDSLKKKFPQQITAYVDEDKQIEIRIYEWTPIDDYDQWLGEYRFCPVIDTEYEISEDVDTPILLVKVENEEFGATGGSVSEEIENLPEGALQRPANSSELLYANNIPDKYDPVGTEKLPRVRNQGGWGTCWAHAAIGAVETNLIHQGIEDSSIDLSELQMAYFVYHDYADPKGLHQNNDYIDQAYNYLEIGGNQEQIAYAFMNMSSPVLEAYVPYSSASSSLVLGEEYAQGYNYAHVNDIIEISTSDSETIKNAILQYGSVVGGVNLNVNESTVEGQKARYSATYNSFYSQSGFRDHFVMIVGWDDNFPRTHFASDCQPEHDGAWLVRNSWGLDDYGLNGYFWLSYDDYAFVNSIICSAYSADENLYDNVYSHAPYYRGFDSPRGYANHCVVEDSYIVDAGEQIEAVTIKIYNAESQMEVTVSDGSTSSKGRISTTNAGIYTIKLDSPLIINDKTEVTVSADISINPTSSTDVVRVGSYVKYNRRVVDETKSHDWYIDGLKQEGCSGLRLLTNNVVPSGTDSEKIEVKNKSICDYPKTTHQIELSEDSTVSVTDIAWTSVDTSVATVDSNGVITIGGSSAPTVIEGRYGGSVVVRINVSAKPFKITYVIDDGVESIGLKTSFYPEDYYSGYLGSQKLYKPGYTHVGWAYSAGAQYPTVYNLMGVYHDVKVYPVWEKQRINVSFNIPLFVSDGEVYYGDSEWLVDVTADMAPFTLPNPPAEYAEIDGLTFSYWSTDRKGENPITEITSDDFAVTADTVNNEYVYNNFIVLYPQFGAKKVMVSLDTMGGTLPEGASTQLALDSNGSYSTLPVPTREGYSFDGWHLNSIDGQLINSGEAIALSDDHSLVAKWIPKLLKVTVDIGTGSELELGSVVSLIAPKNGATVYYKLIDAADDKAYTADEIKEASKYEEAIKFDTAGQYVIYAVAAKDGYIDSDISRFEYTVIDSSKDISQIVIEEDREEYEALNRPEGIWIAGVKSHTYTGSAFKLVPDNNATNKELGFRVYDGVTLLTYKTDYTYSLRNNKNVGEATLTITGKGNYAGNYKKNFEILQKNIADTDITAENVTVQFNNRAQKPSIKVTRVVDGKTVTLKNNTDYTYVWEQTAGAEDYGNKGVKESGTYTVKITGKDKGYTGVRTLDFTILDSGVVLMSKATIKIDKNTFAYDGTQKQPNVTLVQIGKNKLVEGTDYDVSYANNTAVGTAQVIITAKDGSSLYAGSKAVSFKITGTPLSKATFPTHATQIYDESAHEPYADAGAITYKKDRNSEAVELVEGTDYTLTYTKNINAGTATAIFTGINGYTGTVKKTFRIYQFDMKNDASASSKIKFTWADGTDTSLKEFNYTKGGVKPAVQVKFNDTILRQGVDYTVKYSNNSALNDGSNDKRIPTVTIAGKGNFKNTFVKTLTFKIVGTELSGDSVSMSAPDKVVSTKSNSYKVTPTLIDNETGKKLAAGTDYDKNYVYTYVDDVSVYRKSGRDYIKKSFAAGTVVDKDDIIPIGTEIRITVTGIKAYSGTFDTTYRINAGDISRASVALKDKNMKKYYSGKAQTISKDDIVVTQTYIIIDDATLKVKTVRETLDMSDYEIVSYTNNVKKGTATVVLRGTGALGGTKKYTFKINARDISN